MTFFIKETCVLTKRHSNGFTFLELMITVGILVIAITGLLAAFVSSSFLGQANNNKIIAINDGQYVLEKLKNITFDNIASYTDTNYTGLNNESIIVTVSNPSADLKNVVANVTWTERQRQRSFEFTTQISR